MTERNFEILSLVGLKGKYFRILKNGNDINIKLNLINNDKPESLDGQTRVDAETQTHRTGEYPYKDGKKDKRLGRNH